MPSMVAIKFCISRRFGVSFLLAGLCVWPNLSKAQFGPLSAVLRTHRKPDREEELDAYLEIITESKEKDVIQDVDSFIVRFPKSELLGIAYQYQMHAYERLGDFDGTLRAGRKALVSAPDNLDTLLTLAPEIANHLSERPDRVNLLAAARQRPRLYRIRGIGKGETSA